MVGTVEKSFPIFICITLFFNIAFLKSHWSKGKIKMKISHKVVCLWLCLYKPWKLQILQFLLNSFGGVGENNFPSAAQVLPLTISRLPSAIHRGLLFSLFPWWPRTWCWGSGSGGSLSVDVLTCQGTTPTWDLCWKGKVSAKLMSRLPVVLAQGAHLCTGVVLRKQLLQCGSICALKAPWNYLEGFFPFNKPISAVDMRSASLKSGSLTWATGTGFTRKPLSSFFLLACCPGVDLASINLGWVPGGSSFPHARNLHSLTCPGKPESS